MLSLNESIANDNLWSGGPETHASGCLGDGSRDDNVDALNIYIGSSLRLKACSILSNTTQSQACTVPHMVTGNPPACDSARPPGWSPHGKVNLVEQHSEILVPDSTPVMCCRNTDTHQRQQGESSKGYHVVHQTLIY